MDSGDAQHQLAFEAPIRRKSVFMEVGLVDEEDVRGQRSPVPASWKHPKPKRLRPARTVRFRSKNDVFEHPSAAAQNDDDDDWETDSESDDDDNLPRIPPRQDVWSHKIYRLAMLAVVLAAMLPILQISSVSSIGVRGGVIPQTSIKPRVSRLEGRQDSTQVCRRWAGQCKILARATLSNKI